MKKLQVYELCKTLPAQGFTDIDPILLLALGEQESEKDKNDPDNWLSDVPRLEEEYFRRYIVRMNYATTTEVLLSASYGLWQMMGESLREAGWFKDNFAAQTPEYQQLYADPQVKNPDGNPEPEMSEMNVPKSINRYCVEPGSQVLYAAKWFGKKLALAGGNIIRALGYWNGDLSGRYAAQVMAKYNNLSKELKGA